jgi:formylglycine-generating enzyme required for sulfatase activity
VNTSVVIKCVAVSAVYLGISIGFDASGAEEKLPKKYTETVVDKEGNRIHFEMVPIPGGKFLMGSPDGEKGREPDEGPQHQVTVSPFYLCPTETTLELFLAYYQETVTPKKDLTETEEARKEAEQAKSELDAITGPTPVYGDLTMGYAKDHPAIGMTWHNAMTFCRWLSQKTGKKYRLPTEAEWEYACRAGAAETFIYGNDSKLLSDFGWYKDNAEAETHPVGKKKPNGWGLYDMAGNVREWVYDFYSPDAYKQSAGENPAVNPQGPKTGKVHVARGGDYRCSMEELRCAAKTFEEPWWRAGDPQFPKSIWWLPEMDIIGFRVARAIDPNDKSIGN